MKKKLLLFSCFLAAAFTVQAQDSSPTSLSEKAFKPVTGDITTEVAVSLEHGVSLNRGGVRVRKFTAADKAFRLGVQADYTYNKLGDDAYQTTFGVTLAPGMEKHFAGTSRLSPYIGVELPIGYRGSKSESDNHVTEGSWTTGSCLSCNIANFNVGLNGLAGVDYYLAPRFYVGFEIGAGIQYKKYKDVVTTYKNDVTPAEEQKGYHSVSFSPFSTGGIRVGFAF